MVLRSRLLSTLKPWKLSLSFFSSFSHRNDVVTTNISITRHFENGRPDLARQLFDQMPDRTPASWNAMICGYTKLGRHGEALSVLSGMHRSNAGPTETTFSKILSSCERSTGVDEGRAVHCLILKRGAERLELVGCALLYFYSNCVGIGDGEKVFDELCDGNPLVWGVMIACYVRYGMLKDAMRVLVDMPERDVVAWTAMISGYGKSGDECARALELFSWMRSDMVVPNEFTLDSVIRVFGKLGFLRGGKAAHGLVVKYGLEFEHSISGALIEFYCCCESVDDAKRFYDGIVNPCMIASSSIMEGLVSVRRFEEVEIIFDRLREKDSVCCNLMLKGYALSGQVERSKRLFEKMTRKTIFSSNTMISVLSRSGEIENAEALFEETKQKRDTVTWNSMISGYIQNDMHEEAVKLYQTMCRLCINCTRSTFSVLFHSCSCLGSLQLGKTLHAQLIKTLTESNVFVGTTLVDMYSKCGSIRDAQNSFNFTSNPNVATWTALIYGYTIHNKGFAALSYLSRMLQQGIAPNAATFVAVLCACRSSGLTNQGLRFFVAMKTFYGINPSLEHYACVVDLLGRCGNLEEAYEFIEEIPVEADAVILGALLSACWFWMDVRLGKAVAEKMFGLESKPLYAYVVLSNMYGVVGKWSERLELRKRMKSLGAKGPGCSWIELNAITHVFYVEDKSDPHISVVYSTLEHLTTNINYLVHF